MLKLATFLDNPGEPLPETRYRDPRQLVDLGFNGLVLYKTTGLSGLESPEGVSAGEMRRWVQQRFELVTKTIDDATAAGLDAYICYDTITLSRLYVETKEAELTCRGRPNVICPASELAVERSVAGLASLLSRWPKVAGVVLRFGDSDANRLRYLVGNDIYQPHCPRCSHFGRVDRIAMIIERFHDLVIAKLGRRLIVRAWNVRPNGMHDSVDVCQRLRTRLPGDPKDDRLVLSFKFTDTDFWRYQRWNQASLHFGQRPILYELQCQREFEGKGGVPDWQPPLWRDGCPESRRDGELAGLAQVAQHINLAGLWAWVRGGGWGGPFVTNETWIDANVAPVAALADNPSADIDKLAEDWSHARLTITDDATVNAIKQVLANSPKIALQAFYIGPFARSKATPWHPNGDWVQDDVVDADAAWRIIQRLPESELDSVVREKEEAVEQTARDRQALQTALTKANTAVLEPMINTLIYAESLYATLRDLLAGLIAYRRFKKDGGAGHAEYCKQSLLAAQTHWNQHTQRRSTLPGTATAFRETHFWDLTQRMLGELP